MQELFARPGRASDQLSLDAPNRGYSVEETSELSESSRRYTLFSAVFRGYLGIPRGSHLGVIRGPVYVESSPAVAHDRRGVHLEPGADFLYLCGLLFQLRSESLDFFLLLRSRCLELPL